MSDIPFGMIRLLPALTILSLLVMPATAQNFEKGRDAYLRHASKEAIQELRPLAENGDIEAQLLLGIVYSDAYGTAQDDAKAVLWFRKAAKQGHPDAQYRLGFQYFAGLGVRKDHTEAASWYRKAAEQGHIGGQRNIGNMHRYGEGVPQDYVLAHMWLNLAAGQGDPTAAEYRDTVALQMTPAQIAEAQRMAREPMGKH